MDRSLDINFIWKKNIRRFWVLAVSLGVSLASCKNKSKHFEQKQGSAKLGGQHIYPESTDNIQTNQQVPSKLLIYLKPSRLDLAEAENDEEAEDEGQSKNKVVTGVITGIVLAGMMGFAAKSIFSGSSGSEINATKFDQDLDSNTKGELSTQINTQLLESNKIVIKVPELLSANKNTVIQEVTDGVIDAQKHIADGIEVEVITDPSVIFKSPEPLLLVAAKSSHVDEVVTVAEDFATVKHVNHLDGFEILEVRKTHPPPLSPVLNVSDFQAGNYPAGKILSIDSDAEMVPGKYLPDSNIFLYGQSVGGGKYEVMQKNLTNINFFSKGSGLADKELVGQLLKQMEFKGYGLQGISPRDNSCWVRATWRSGLSMILDDPAKFEVTIKRLRESSHGYDFEHGLDMKRYHDQTLLILHQLQQLSPAERTRFLNTDYVDETLTTYGRILSQYNNFERRAITLTLKELIPGQKGEALIGDWEKGRISVLSTYHEEALAFRSSHWHEYDHMSPNEQHAYISARLSHDIPLPEREILATAITTDYLDDLVKLVKERSVDSIMTEARTVEWSRIKKFMDDDYDQLVKAFEGIEGVHVPRSPLHKGQLGSNHDIGTLASALGIRFKVAEFAENASSTKTGIYGHEGDPLSDVVLLGSPGHFDVLVPKRLQTEDLNL